MLTRNRIRSVVAMVAVFLMLLPGMALADIVTNDVSSTVGGKVLTIQAGSSAVVRYSVQNQNNNAGDTQNNCNPADGTPLTISAVGVPSGVTAPSTQATDCNTNVGSITFTVGSTTTAGDYAITHGLTDTGGGRYVGTTLDFTLRIPAPADSTAPVITPNVTGTTGDNGWYTSDVSLTWSVVDNESAISSRSGCDAVSITADQQATTYTCTATSAGGTNSESVSIKRDATAPVVNPASVVNSVWRNSSLSQAFTASDGTSGLANPGDASFTLTASAESANATTPTTDSKTVTDAAGNSTTRALSAKIDLSGPDISGSDITDTTWRRTALSGSFTASDGLSGLKNTADASFTLTASDESTSPTAPTTVSKTVEDNVGNSTTRSLSALIDKTAPVISGPDVNNTTWRNTPLSESFTASDALSGLANATDGSFTLTAAAQSADANTPTTVSKTVADKAGNTSTRTLSALIDTTNPVVTVTSVTNGASYTLGSVPAASCSTTDALSGVKTQAAPDVSGGPVGSVTVTCSGGEDNAGNVASPVSVSYRVAYHFVGFDRPVDNGSVLNKAKAGQAIPLKWRLLDGNGNPILNLSTAKVTVVSLTCNSGTSADLVEEYAAGSSGLQNLGDGYYQINWKTPTTYANSCKTMNLDLGEGAMRTALFQFTK